MHFATSSGCPRDDAEVVCIGYNIVFQAGILKEACPDWTRMATADQTLEKLKRYFANREKERHDEVTATPAAGYPGAAATANMVQTLTPAALSDLMTELALYCSAAAANQAIRINSGGPAITGNPIPVSYCWSHGTSSYMAHTSATCHSMLNGHQDVATESTKLGEYKKVWSASDRNPR